MVGVNDFKRNGTLRIRLYRPEDREQVVRLFSQGMVGLAGVGYKDLIRNRRPLQFLSYAVPAAAIALTPPRCSITTRAFAGLVAASVVPLAIFGYLRRVMKRYVAKSMTEDLSIIESFYSATGAGHGSAFWVAELVLDEPCADPTLTVATKLMGSASNLTAEKAPQMHVPAESSATVLSSACETADASDALTADDSLGASPDSSSNDSDVAVCQEEQSTTCSGDTQGASVVKDSPPADEGNEVRRLVSGIVAAAIAKFEFGTTPPNPVPASATTTPSSTEAKPKSDKAGKAGGLQILQTQGSVTEAAPKPSPGPATPGVSKEVRSQWSYSTPPPTGSIKTSPSSSRLRQASESAALNGATSFARSPSTAAISFATSAAAAPTSTSSSKPGPAARTTRSIIVGHVGVQRKSWQLAELKRMSVAPGFRGMGIGRKLLDTLIQHARDNQFRELELWTSCMQQPAQRLYESAGMVVAQECDYKGVSIYNYRLDLTKKR